MPAGDEPFLGEERTPLGRVRPPAEPQEEDPTRVAGGRNRHTWPWQACLPGRPLCHEAPLGQRCCPVSSSRPHTTLLRRTRTCFPHTLPFPVHRALPPSGEAWEKTSPRSPFPQRTQQGPQTGLQRKPGSLSFTSRPCKPRNQGWRGSRTLMTNICRCFPRSDSTFTFSSS